VVSGCVQCEMESFDGVQSCFFLMVMKYLHYVADGAKGVCIALEVFCEIGSKAVVVKSIPLFFVASVELYPFWPT